MARASKTMIDPNFGVSPEVEEWAKKHGYTPYLQSHLEYFKDYAEAPGAKYFNWDAAFRNAIRGDWGGVRRGAQFKERADAKQSPIKKNPFAGLFWGKE